MNTDQPEKWPVFKMRAQRVSCGQKNFCVAYRYHRIQNCNRAKTDIFLQRLGSQDVVQKKADVLFDGA